VSNTAILNPAIQIMEWVALTLTTGLGPTTARKLVEHFGSAEAVLRASLTELEGAGIQAISAQSLATGKSAELAREELARARCGCHRVVDGRSSLSAPAERDL